MSRVIVDEILRSRLHNLSEPLELCDDSGRVLGRVFPAMPLSEYEPCEPRISPEELRRREESHENRYTTVEVLACLEKL